MILRLVISSILLFTYISCKNVLTRPKVESINISLAKFDHKNTKDNCSSCHLSTRPISKSHIIIHGGGNDCSLCHLPTKWKEGKYGHTPKPITCNECHLNKQPKPKKGFPHWANRDCVECHIVSRWKKSIYTHPTQLKKCILCHLKDSPNVFHGMNAECLYCHKADEDSW